MGNLIDLNSQIPDSRIPDAIARDAELATAIAAHIGASDPHPAYLLQSEGDALYRRTAVPLADADIPSLIARDAEVAAAIVSHVTAQHSVLCTLFSTVVAAVGLETIISFSPIAATKIVNISAQIIENLGASGLRYILKAGGGDFNPSPFLRFGAIRVPAVTASQLVGLPLHILVWHIA